MSRKKLAPRLRARVIERARGWCEYCKTPREFSIAPFSVDHIQPLARGGADDEANLALSCEGCNGAKGTAVEAVDPETGKRVALFHPRRDTWREHFIWSSDFTEILGRSPTGRATVAKLDMNREGVVNIRRGMRALGFTRSPEE